MISSLSQPHTAVQHALWAIKHRPAWAQSGAFLAGTCVAQQSLACALIAALQDPAPRRCFVCSTSSSQLPQAATLEENPARIPTLPTHAVAVRDHSSFVPRPQLSRLLRIRAPMTSSSACR